MSDLDDLLPDNPETEAPESEVTAETPETEAAETEEQVEPKEEPKEPETVPLAALIEQRKDFQAKMDAIQSRLEQVTQPKPEPVQTPDFVDPEGAQFMQAQMSQMQAHFAAELSETKARARFGDEHVDEAIKAAQTAGVVDQFKGQPDAWGKLATWHKQQKVVSEIGEDPAAYKEKLRAELLKEVKAELAAEQVKEVSGKAAPSLANMQGTGNAAKPSWNGPTPLDDLIG